MFSLYISPIEKIDYKFYVSHVTQQEIMDEIASPAFDLREFMLANVYNEMNGVLYLGFYCDGEFVRIDYGSPLYNTVYRDPYSQYSTDSLLSWWNEEYTYRLTPLLQNILSAKQIIDLCCECLINLTQAEYREKIINAIDIVKSTGKIHQGWTEHFHLKSALNRIVEMINGMNKREFSNFCYDLSYSLQGISGTDRHHEILSGRRITNFMRAYITLPTFLKACAEISKRL